MNINWRSIGEKIGEQWQAVNVHLANPVNSLPQLGEYLGGTATVLGEIHAGMFNIPNPGGESFFRKRITFGENLGNVCLSIFRSIP